MKNENQHDSLFRTKQRTEIFNNENERLQL